MTKRTSTPRTDAKSRRTDRVVGYVRVSTDEQATSGLGLEAQRAAIADRVRTPGLGAGRGLRGRRGQRQEHGRSTGPSRGPERRQEPRADALVVAKLDRLSRSLLDFAALMEDARKEGWALVILDLGVDTTTPSGEMIANVMATFAQFERRLIGQRTKDALAVKKRQGVRLGRPRR